MSIAATVVFLLAAGFVLYVLFLYPLLLWVVARSARPVRKEPIQPRVSVILAVHNGERWLRSKLESILALDYPRDLLEIFVISDGSSDSTDAIAREFAGQGVKLVRIPRQGKWAAINAGLAQVTGDVLFFTDVRQALDPQCLRRLVAPLADPAVGVVSGELVIREGETMAEANTGLYWRYEKWIRKHHAAIDSVLGATGAIYVMRRNLAVPLPPDTLLDDVYLPMAAFFRGYRLLLETSAKAYDVPASLDTEFRRKVRTLAGNYQIIRAYPGLLGPSNRMWIHFLSHKFGRLLLPFALAVCAVTGFLLPWPWSWAAVGVQGAFYFLAVLDLLVPESVSLKRLTSPVRTFVVLMAATACAAQILFVPANRFWRSSREVA